MAAIADFLSDILGGCELIALGMALGGLAWCLGVLRLPRPQSPLAAVPPGQAIAVIRWGALGLALGQAVELGCKALILGDAMGRSPFPAFYGMAYVDAGAVRAVLALALAIVAWRLGRAPQARRGWVAALLLGLAITVAGAWLTHGASRIDDRGAQMAVTAVHAVAGAVWVGGVIEILVLRRLIAREPRLQPLWGVALVRFAPVAIVAVAALVAGALPLGLYYVRSWGGLAGTGYGALVLTKIAMFGIAIGFAALNNRAGRRWRAGAGGSALARRVPYYIEAEAGFLLALMLAAASLSSQPPAIDITTEQASFHESLAVFAPRLPRITSPAHAEMPVNPTNPLAMTARDEALEAAWSDYNHNVSGLILIAMSILAVAARWNRFRWARHWPLGFVVLAVFLFFRSDPSTWPSGPVGFFQSLGNAEVFQHRLATLLALALGLFEWRARVSARLDPRYRYIFPVLSAAGGILLLTHSHSAFEVKSQFLIQLSHTAMAFFALCLAAGRWLELRLDGPAARWAGGAANVSLLLIGVILAFYQEYHG